LIGWMVRHVYFGADPGPKPAQRVLSPVVPRPPAALPKPAPPDLEAAATTPSVAEGAGEVSSIGRRRSSLDADPRNPRPANRTSAHAAPGIPETSTTAPNAMSPAAPRENDLELAL